MKLPKRRRTVKANLLLLAWAVGFLAAQRSVWEGLLSVLIVAAFGYRLVDARPKPMLSVTSSFAKSDRGKETVGEGIPAGSRVGRVKNGTAKIRPPRRLTSKR